MSTMKQFGLEFIVKDQATRTLRNLNREIQNLETSMKRIIPIASSFEKKIGNLNTTKSVNQINRLNGTLRNYNTTLKQVGKNTGVLPTKGAGGDSGGSSSSNNKKDWMSADYYRDTAGHLANSVGTAFNSMPFGSIIGNAVSSSLEGVVTGAMTGNPVTALAGVLTAGVDTAMGIYNTSSELVHNAIYSAFQKGSELFTSLFTKYLPATLNREYDIEKLSAVLQDDSLAKSLNKLGVDYAKMSSLSLSDMDFILPNLVMANKATGVKNDSMEAILQKQMDAVVRLNFKDSGQGAGVTGSLVALQEMLSGDYISLKRRFEMSSASIDRIKEAEAKDGVMGQMEALIKELESMGVTNGAIEQVRKTAKMKFEFIGESISDFLTNPSTGIFATLLSSMSPILDNVANFFDTGGNKLTGFNPETGQKESVTQLEIFTMNMDMVIGKLGEVALKLFEGIGAGLSIIDWGGLWSNTSALLDTISTYFKPTFEILGTWVNTDFIPFLGRMNGYLQDGAIRDGILNYIKGLTDIASNSLLLIETITKNMPTIASVVDHVSRFVKGVLDNINSITNLFSNIKTGSVQNDYKTGSQYNGASSKKKGTKNAKGNPFVPYDNYPALLHRGERVLTAQQNKQLDKSNTQGVTVNVSGLTVREEADIKKIARAFVKELNESSLTYGGVY